MPEVRSRNGAARRSAWLVVAFCCAAAAGQPPPVSLPATRPAVETLAAARRRLTRTASKDRTRSDRALLAGLELALAIGRADGTAAGNLIDVVGYQSLPLAGPLPERPAKPVTVKDLSRLVAARSPVDLAHLTLDQVFVATRAELQSEFPAVAAWMLPQDLAVVFRPFPDERAGWIKQPACVVVRLRGERATVIGGNLLEAVMGAP